MNMLPSLNIEGFGTTARYNYDQAPARYKVQGYEIWIAGMRFPVAPSEIEISGGSESNIIKLADTTSISIQQMPNLTRYSFTLWIPAVKRVSDWWIQTKGSEVESSFQRTIQIPYANLENPSIPANFNDRTPSLVLDTNYNQVEYIDHLNKLSTTLEPFDFVILRNFNLTQELFTSASRVTLEPFTISQSASRSRFDIYVNMELLEYRPPKVFRGYQVNDGKGNITWDYKSVTQEPIVNIPKFTAITAETDSLWKVGKREYGTGAAWGAIDEANLDLEIIPNSILPGTVIKLPAQSVVDEYLRRIGQPSIGGLTSI